MTMLTWEAARLAAVALAVLAAGFAVGWFEIGPALPPGWFASAPVPVLSPPPSTRAAPVKGHPFTRPAIPVPSLSPYRHVPVPPAEVAPVSAVPVWSSRPPVTAAPSWVPAPSPSLSPPPVPPPSVTLTPSLSPVPTVAPSPPVPSSPPPTQPETGAPIS